MWVACKNKTPPNGTWYMNRESEMPQQKTVYSNMYKDYRTRGKIAKIKSKLLTI